MRGVVEDYSDCITEKKPVGEWKWGGGVYQGFYQVI